MTERCFGRRRTSRGLVGAVLSLLVTSCPDPDPGVRPCNTDQDCPAPGICSQGICIDPCTLCSPHQYCSSGRCYDEVRDAGPGDLREPLDRATDSTDLLLLPDHVGRDPGHGPDATPDSGHRTDSQLCAPLTLRCSEFGDVERCSVDGSSWNLHDSCQPGAETCIGAQCTCIPLHHRACSDGDVYWFDGCGDRGPLDEECGSLFCETSACVSLVTCTAGHKRCTPGGDVEICNPEGTGWSLHEDCPDHLQECIGESCVCISHHHRSCSDGDVYWFDGCDSQEEMYEDCSTPGHDCNAGACACASHHHKGCTNDTLVWFDSCGLPEDPATAEACATGFPGVCAAGQQGCHDGALTCVVEDQLASAPLAGYRASTLETAGGTVCGDAPWLDPVISIADGVAVGLAQPSSGPGEPLLLAGHQEVACVVLEVTAPTLHEVLVHARNTTEACGSPAGGEPVAADLFAASAADGSGARYLGSTMMDDSFSPADRFRIHPPQAIAYLLVCRPPDGISARAQIEIDAILLRQFGPESCNGEDDDCDGAVDDGVHFTRDGDCIDDGDVGPLTRIEPDLPLPWYAFAAFVHDSFIYALGGRNQDTTILDSVYRIAINSDGSLGPSWVEQSPLPHTKCPHLVTYSLGNRNWVMMVGGYVPADPGPGSDETAEVMIAELLPGGDLGGWQTTTPLPRRLRNFWAVHHNGFIYIPSGYDGDLKELVRAVTIGELSTDGSAVVDWHEESPTGMRQSADAAALAVDGYLYMIGGSDAEFLGATERSIVINPDGSLGDAWTILPPVMDGWSRRATAIYASGWVYLPGGSYHNATSGYLYDKVNSTPVLAPGDTSTWSIASSGSNGTYYRSLVYVVHNGYFYALGGRQGSTNYAEVFRIAF